MFPSKAFPPRAFTPKVFIRKAPQPPASSPFRKVRLGAVRR